MPSKKSRAKAKKAAAARAPQPAPAKALAGPGQDDLARSKKADLRATRRFARNYGNGSDTVSTLDDQRCRAMITPTHTTLTTLLRQPAELSPRPLGSVM